MKVIDKINKQSLRSKIDVLAISFGQKHMPINW